MRHETRDELRHETSRPGRPCASSLRSQVSGLRSHVSLLGAVASLLLVALVWALFRQTWDFDFLRLDDPSYTYLCPFVKDGLSWANVREAFTNVRHEAIWMPVTNISYMCTISLIGPDAGAHHLVSVAIHALNAVLLLWLLVALGQRASCPLTGGASGTPRPTTGTTGILPVAAAFLLTAFWTLHPQRAEAVAWIASRKELLCTTFVLGGLLCWLRARRREGWGWIPALAGVYACFALACMSKPTAMCFPFLVLAVEGMMVSGDMRHTTCDMREAAFGIRHSTFYILNFAFFLLMAAAVGALAVYSQTHPEGHAELALFSAPLWWRILNAAVAVGLYIFQMFIPVGIHLDYRAVPGGWPVHGVLGLSVLAFVALGIAGAWWWCRRYRRRAGQETDAGRATLFFVLSVSLWFFASLAPTLGIFGSFGEHARADRFLYLPAMALPIAGAMLYGARALPTGTTGILSVACLGIYVAISFAVAYPIVASYRTDMTAFTHTLEADPDNWRALAHVGEAKCIEGVMRHYVGNADVASDREVGIDMLRRSRKIMPHDTTDRKLAYALMNRGGKGDWDEIIDVCSAFSADPSRDLSGMALEALGTAELMKRRWTDAAEHLRRSILAKEPYRPQYYSREDARLKYACAICFNTKVETKEYEEAKDYIKRVCGQSTREDLRRRAKDLIDLINVWEQWGGRSPNNIPSLKW